MRVLAAIDGGTNRQCDVARKLVEKMADNRQPRKPAHRPYARRGMTEREVQAYLYDPAEMAAAAEDEGRRIGYGKWFVLGHYLRARESV